jgi:hypothetical protein
MVEALAQSLYSFSSGLKFWQWQRFAVNGAALLALWLSAHITATVITGLPFSADAIFAVAGFSWIYFVHVSYAHLRSGSWPYRVCVKPSYSSADHHEVLRIFTPSIAKTTGGTFSVRAHPGSGWAATLLCREGPRADARVVNIFRVGDIVQRLLITPAERLSFDPALHFEKLVCGWSRRVFDGRVFMDAFVYHDAGTAASEGAAAVTRHQADVAGSTCVVCLAPLLVRRGRRFADTPMVLEACGHVFHAGCIERWLARKQQCPTCRCDATSTKPAVQRE